jgi:predicted transcriptional regulator
MSIMIDIPRKSDVLTLEILRTIHAKSDVTQRDLARRTGIALGLANLYSSTASNKGLAKIQHAPPNRYLYYLTPKGFTAKSRLTT